MSDDTKVIDLEQKKKERETEKYQKNIKELKKTVENNDAYQIFTEAVKRNQANKARLKKEREAANEKTKQLYKIQHKRKD